MPLIHHPVDQGSPEWHALRVGRLTASRAYAAFKRNKDGKFSAKRAQLVAAMAAERVSGIPAYDAPFETASMSRGRELEVEAVEAYERQFGVEVIRSGFWTHPEKMVGVSLDGHLENRVIETKCFWPAKHVEVARAARGGKDWREVVPEEYHWQVTHEVALTELGGLDFVAYAGVEWPEASRLIVVPVEAGEVDVAGYWALVDEFLAEVDRLEEELRGWQ